MNPGTNQINIDKILLTSIENQLKALKPEPVNLKDVIRLIGQINERNGDTGKSAQNLMISLMTYARRTVESKKISDETKQIMSFDSEALALIEENEKQLNRDMHLFCEAFNKLCVSLGVVAYFQTQKAEAIWLEVTAFCQAA